MRILQVLQSEYCGGAERHVLELIQQLQHRGHDLIFAGQGQSWLMAECQEQGVETCELPLKRYFSLHNVMVVKRLLQQEKVDLIHIHILPKKSCIIRDVRLAALLAKVPVVATVHSLSSKKYTPKKLPLIALSEHIEDHLIESGFDAWDVHHVYHGLADRQFTEEEKQQLKSELLSYIHVQDKLIFGVFTRFEPQSGHETLLEAISQISGDVRARIQVLFLGDHESEYGSYIRQQVAEMGLEDVVYFAGHVTSPEMWMATLDVVINPAEQNNISLSMIESTVQGIPILSSEIQQNNEFVVHDRNGWLYKVGDPLDCADKIEQITLNQESLTRLGARNRTLFLKYFQMSSMIDKIESLFLAILNDEETSF